MKKLLSILLVAGLLNGCGEPIDPPVSCDAIATCQPWEEEVPSCDGLEDCRVERICGTSTACIPLQISASDYDQSCSVDADCVLMNEGHPCDCHVCPDGAINAGELEAYQADVVGAECGVVECPAIGCGEDLVAACVSGTCEVQEAGGS